MKKTVWYINATSNHDRPPWEYSGGFIPVGEDPSDWCDLGPTGEHLPYTPKVMANRNKGTVFSMHMACKSDGLSREEGTWTAFYRWDSKKGKFVCTRYRDVLRKQRRIALLQSLKQDLAIAQS